jgi:hypothetical protein
MSNNKVFKQVPRVAIPVKTGIQNHSSDRSLIMILDLDPRSGRGWGMKKLIHLGLLFFLPDMAFGVGSGSVLLSLQGAYFFGRVVQEFTQDLFSVPAEGGRGRIFTCN